MRRFRMILALLMTLLIGLLTVGVALGYDEDDDKDDNGKTYSVTVTNLTKRQVLTPPLLISHDWSYHLFMAGKPANEKLAVLAESGDYKPLMMMLRDNDKVFDLMAGEAIPPSESKTVMIETRGKFVSVVGMLASTNDAFYALKRIRLPKKGSKSRTVVAYDAGSEENTELCSDIPGPCTSDPDPPDGSNDRATEKAEGFVHVHNGIHGLDEFNGLKKAFMDWRNPVAKVVITRMKKSRR